MKSKPWMHMVGFGGFLLIVSTLIFGVATMQSSDDAPVRSVEHRRGPMVLVDGGVPEVAGGAGARHEDRFPGKTEVTSEPPPRHHGGRSQLAMIMGAVTGLLGAISTLIGAVTKMILALRVRKEKRRLAAEEKQRG